MTPLLYAKLGAAVLVVVLLFGAGYRVGGLASKAALEALRAEQSSNTAKAVLAERASAAVELARVNARLKEFEDAPIDPVVTGIASRLYAYTGATECAVRGTGVTTGGTIPASGIPRGDPEAKRLSQDAFDAGSRDAKRLNLCRTVWPR